MPINCCCSFSDQLLILTLFLDHEYQNKPLPRTCRALVTPFERQTSHQTGMDDHRVDYG